MEIYYLAVYNDNQMVWELTGQFATKGIALNARERLEKHEGYASDRIMLLQRVE